MALQHLAEDLHAAVDGAAEVLLLGADHLGDVGLLLPEVGVLTLVLMDDGVHHLKEEGTVHTQQLAVTGSAAQQTAQHIAAALVAGQDAVADHEAGGADVVGDDAQGHVPGVALAIVGAGDLADLLGDVHHGVHVEQGVDVLTCHSQTLQAHTGIDVLLHQIGVVAMAVIVELGEHIVPDLHVAVAFAAHGAAGLAAAVLRAAVIVHLGAGAAGAGAVLPEVVLLAEAEDAVLGKTDLVVPDVEGLVVVLVDRGVQTIGLQAHHLGQKLPGPMQRIVLEVVAEGEVAQHLEVSAVAGGLAHIVDIAGADALLAGTDAVTGRLLLALEPGLHGSHTGIDEQNGLIALGDQGKAGQAQVPFAFKVAEEQFPQLIDAMIGMRHNISPFQIDFSRIGSRG